MPDLVDELYAAGRLVDLDDRQSAWGVGARDAAPTFWPPFPPPWMNFSSRSSSSNSVEENRERGRAPRLMAPRRHRASASNMIVQGDPVVVRHQQPAVDVAVAAALC